MPLHLRLSAEGAILGVGPTLARLLEAAEPVPVGRPFEDVFVVRRPANVRTASALIAHGDRRLRLVPRLPVPQLPLTGLAIAVDDGALLNLSFGISVVEAVRILGLTARDFAPTDVTVEMLFLIEANKSVMEESRRRNRALFGAKQTAQKQAETDMLTGLANRRAFDSRLEGILATGSAFALLHLDLDYFKQVNDTRGHAAGDEVLQVVADRLLRELRTRDVVARVGGDEFILLVTGTEEETAIADVCQRVIATLEEPIPYQDASLRISGSIGIALAYADRDGSPTAARLIEEADLALYRSKHLGRGCHTFFTPDLAEEATSQGP